MKRILLALLSLVMATAANAQGVPYFPQTLPASTVVGRLSTGPGVTQAIPFAYLATAIGNSGGLLSITSPGSADFVFGSTSQLGFYKNLGSGARIHRFRDRVFVGSAAADNGTTAPTTYISSAGLGGWHSRSAQFASFSQNGGTGGLFATRTSDRYTSTHPTATIWQASSSVSLNAVLAWSGRIYQVTTAGTTGVSAPVHTTGSAANGTATLLFLDFSYTAPIGLSAVLVNDQVEDGQGSWARYVLSARMSANAGTTYAEETNVANYGNDVANNPYSIFPAGSSIGYWIAAGYDGAISPTTNPSTAAILIGSGDNDFNKGIVFQANAFVGPVIAMADTQEVAWYVTGGTKRGTITYDSGGLLAHTGAVNGYSFDGRIVPAASDGAALGSTTLMWSDLFLASGAVINFNNGDVTLTHSANTLAFAGASSGYTFDAVIAPATSDGAALGSTTLMWSDLFLASGSVINFNNGDITITHSNNLLSFNQATSGYSFGQGPIRPNVDDGVALGTSSAGFSDLFLASGAVINFANGNMALTHSSALITVTGGDFDVQGLLRADSLRIDQTPTAVSGAGPIAIGSGSTINTRIQVNMNGTTYWIPASTTAF